MTDVHYGFDQSMRATEWCATIHHYKPAGATSPIGIAKSCLNTVIGTTSDCEVTYLDVSNLPGLG